ncbi:MAG: DMT family transporter [Candidatus Thioglobus sp.]|nr:DMT family transporter [Candidatus Thioglobus sp.]
MNNRLYFWMVLAMLFWGASWPIANVLSAYITEHEFITYRYVLTSITMVPVLVWMKLSFKIDWLNLTIAALAALLLIFYTKFYFLSTQYGSPGLSGAVVTTLMPILVYLLMLFSQQKKPKIIDWLALGLGAAGVITTMDVWHLSAEQIWISHNIYMVAAASFWAVMSIVSSYAKRINPAVLSFYIYLITAIIDALFFFKPTYGSIFAMDGIFWINFLIVTIASTTFATTVYFLGLQRLGSRQGSVFTFLVPLFAVGLSVIFLKETWQWTTIVGAIMTIVALIILNKIKLNFYNKHS